MASSSLKQTELEFTNANAATGSISFDTNNKIQVNRTLQSSGGIVATSFAVSGDSNYVASTDFDDITAGDLKVKDDSGNVVTITAPSSVTAHTLTLSATQGAANSKLENDGSGNLSFAAPIVGRMRRETSNSSFDISSLSPISYSATDFNSGITCSESNGTMVVSKAGIYCLSASLSLDSIGLYTFCAIAKVNSDTFNGKHVLFIHDADSQSDNLFGQAGTCYLDLNANDSVTVHLRKLDFTGLVSDNVSGGTNHFSVNMHRL